MFDPIEKAEEICSIVVDDNKRKYYRISRAGRFYGGIATCDCVGCNLDCVFCWSNYPRNNPKKCGRFYNPESIFQSLVSTARRYGYRQLRISGNEITISKKHLIELLKIVNNTNYIFILETNGTLIDEDYARELKIFKNLRVRVSFKGTNRDEFALLTGANPSGFDRQLLALENLYKNKISCWASVVISFSTEENVKNFKKLIGNVSKFLAERIEYEMIFILPHVKKRLEEKGIEPIIYENTILNNGIAK
ncbi:MAG: radical SAM protein [Candidatus Marinimicrobia bacterium]|nr:radical SAM protein [Candidatus Neomarinimicrobiota bacterium]